MTETTPTNDTDTDTLRRLHRPRTEADLRMALHNFCNAAWNPGVHGHIFSIPPQPNDADIVLGDGIDELVRLRQEVARLEARIAELEPPTDPRYHQDNVKWVSADLYAARRQFAEEQLARLARQEKEIDRLREALAPFAALGVPDYWQDNYILPLLHVAPFITVGDVRAAQRALAADE